MCGAIGPGHATAIQVVDREVVWGGGVRIRWQSVARWHWSGSEALASSRPVQPVGICNIETWRAFLRILTLMGCKIAFIRYNVVLGSFSLDERQGGLASPLR